MRINEIIPKIIKDEVLTRSAALAFYSCFALGPIILLLMWVLNVVQLAIHEEIAALILEHIGSEAKSVFQMIISNIKERPDLASLSGWVGASLLIFSSSLTFSELQNSLNVIFKAEILSEKSASVLSITREYILRKLVSFLMVFLTIILGISSAILSTGLRHFVKHTNYLIGEMIHFIAVFLIFTLVFGLIFKLLPDKRLQWRESFLGGVCTSLLFLLGKTVVAFYLGETEIGSTYGTARSFILVLIWIYYSTFVVLVGAECSYSLISLWQKKKQI